MFQKLERNVISLSNGFQGYRCGGRLSSQIHQRSETISGFFTEFQLLDCFESFVQILNNHPQVEKVHHPSVTDDESQKALYAKYFPNGGGSIFTFEIKGDAQTAKDFIDNLELFSLLANVADVKSLVIHPATTTHSQCTEEELLDQGIKPNTIRLSIGTENIDDIIQDLDEAFKAIQ